MIDDEEIFKDIPNYEGIYKISNFGNVKSYKYGKEKQRKTSINERGYVVVCLRDGDNNQRSIKVHVLVAIVFHGFEANGKQDLVVDHKDDIKSNCRADNLQIITQRENTKKHFAKTKGFVGVDFMEQNKKWRSRIFINGKSIHLGLFEKKEIAIDIYKKALENISLFTGDAKEFKNKIFNYE